jgi:hypothetical protein
MDQANRQMLDALVAQRRRVRDRRRTDAPIAAIDALIADLEELLLLGHRAVPDTFAPRLRRLAGALPAPTPDLLRPTRITALMDLLFTEQGRLLAVRTGGAALPDLDELGDAADG